MLSGGGVKGCYTYGFFKELYKQYPDYPINKVYGVSVGAINSMPILTKKMHVLDKFWNDPLMHPFDIISNDWDPTKNSIRDRVHAFVKNGSLLKSLKSEPFVEFLESNREDMTTVRRKLVVISYNKVTLKPAYHRCIDPITTFESIAGSSRFPGLFDSIGYTNIDGCFVDLDSIIAKYRDQKWLYIDLQKRSRMVSSKKIRIFSPKVSNIPGVNSAMCLLSNRASIDNLIENGRADANAYINQVQIMQPDNAVNGDTSETLV